MNSLIPPLLDAWQVPEPRSVRLVSESANNRTFFVESSAGRSVLRLALTGSHVERIQYEHAVLSALNSRVLPFAVPDPIPAVDGATVLPVGHAGDGWATLHVAIPGQPPTIVEETSAYQSGAALGTLDRVLGEIVLDASREVNSFGDLRTTHPLVPDPIRSIGALPISTDTRAGLAALLGTIKGFWSSTGPLLPQQNIHTDYDPSNVLMDRHRVTAVLDFELAGPSARAMDLAAGLHGFVGWPRDAATYWSLTEAFATGYLQELAITDAEIAVLPNLIRLRQAVSVIRRIGRWRQGHTTDDDLATRNEMLHQLDDMLSMLSEQLVDRIARRRP